MPHTHSLRDGQKTGPDLATVSGDHIHELPSGEITGPSPEGQTHVHSLPDGSITPGGPMPIKDDSVSPDLKLDL